MEVNLHMKRIRAALFVLLILCSLGSVSQAKETGYQRIDQETAKEMMDQDDGHVIVDVRTKEEYDEGHIPGAVCIPNESIGCD